MVQKTKYFILPLPIVNEEKTNPLTKDLYLSEIGEIIVESGSIWSSPAEEENHLLAYCTKGDGILVVSGEQVPVSGDQFFIIPQGCPYKYYSGINAPSQFLVAFFGGEKAFLMGKEFSNVRNLIPSVNNLVANREMLFDEIFKNLSRGFHNENIEYINFCFGHLLATFVYACQNSDDLADETNPAVRRSLDFMAKNLGQKLTLVQISKQIGLSPTYFTAIFKKETGYAPLSYFAHLKILKACEFLDHTKNKVKEISFSLGYSDPYYFTKDFKKKMGLSPRQYRNRVN